MMTKYLRLGVALIGATFAFGSLAACSDDSTASAPITSNPVTTTSLYGASDSSSAESSAAASAADGSESESPSPTTGGSSLPATAPKTTTQASGTFAAPEGQPLSDKSKRYLQALRDDNVQILGDTDNSVALTLAVYVCDAQAKNTDPVTTKGYVTALVAPGAKNPQEANTKADKVIKAAKAHYC